MTFFSIAGIWRAAIGSYKRLCRRTFSRQDRSAQSSRSLRRWSFTPKPRSLTAAASSCRQNDESTRRRVGSISTMGLLARREGRTEAQCGTDRNTSPNNKVRQENLRCTVGGKLRRTFPRSGHCSWLSRGKHLWRRLIEACVFMTAKFRRRYGLLCNSGASFASSSASSFKSCLWVAASCASARRFLKRSRFCWWMNSSKASSFRADFPDSIRLKRPGSRDVPARQVIGLVI